MNILHHAPAKQAGFNLFEVLVTLIILLVGLLGLAGLNIQATRSEMESYQRVQALILLDDMVQRINANREVASCYAITNDTTGTPHLGTSATINPDSISCSGTTAQVNRAKADLRAWSDLLAGAAETAGGNVGAMIGGRGCISNVGADTYRVSVAWQGLADTASPPQTCSQDVNYGSEARRRVVSLDIRIGCLTC